MKRIAFFLSCLVAAGGAAGQSFCVRAGAPAPGDGLTWSSAFPALPPALTRGATYYIADGDYGGYVFDDPEAGESYITIKKATAADHGTQSGWAAGYGDGVANFIKTASDAVLVFQNSYYVIDGQKGGGPASWTSGHGFKLSRTTQGTLVDFRGPDWWRPPLPTHITLAHIELAQRGIDMDAPNECGIYQSLQSSNPRNGDPGEGSSFITVRYCYLHDFGYGGFPIFTFESSNWLFEYNYVSRNSSSDAYHSEGWQDFGSDHMTIRHNFWDSIQGTAIIALKRNYKQICTDWKIYGNIFYYPPGYARSGVGMGVVGDARDDGQISDPDWRNYGCNDVLFYNNTVVRVPGWNSGIFLPVGTGNRAYNNIWYDCKRYTADAGGDNLPNTTFSEFGGNYAAIDHDYNIFTFSLMSNQARAANELLGGGDIFVGSASGNLALNIPTAPGLPLPSPYDTDQSGALRGADGSWDRGAFEYSGAYAPPPPTGLRIRTP